MNPFSLRRRESTTAEVFELLAETFWRSIKRFDTNRIRLNEDAITSINLDALASSSPQVMAFEDSRANEKNTGCDFEFWIRLKTGGWKNYAVQAKKISVGTGKYNKLNYKVGQQRQIDILEKYATTKPEPAVPIYCFYNYSNTEVGWNCCLPQAKEQLGVTIAPLDVVKDALVSRGQRTFESIHNKKKTLPWRCLLNCAGSTCTNQSADIDWLNNSDGIHSSLPKHIQTLVDLQNGGAKRKGLEHESLVLSDNGLIPKWIVVIDVPISELIASRVRPFNPELNK
jgi:hypothetical protein